MNFATELLHYGLLPDKNTGSTTLPIYQTAAYRQDSPENLEKIFVGTLKSSLSLPSMKNLCSL